MFLFLQWIIFVPWNVTHCRSLISLISWKTFHNSMLWLLEIAEYLWVYELYYDISYYDVLCVFLFDFKFLWHVFDTFTTAVAKGIGININGCTNWYVKKAYFFKGITIWYIKKANFFKGTGGLDHKYCLVHFDIFYKPVILLSKLGSQVFQLTQLFVLSAFL